MTNINQDSYDLIKNITDITGVTETEETFIKICSSVINNKTHPVRILLTGGTETARTTAIRKIGALFKAMGIISADRGVMETTREDFVSEYMGQTALLVNEICNKAEGGILFIDEVYNLVRDPQDSAGFEAIDTLIKRMDDDGNKYTVIAAGDEKRMKTFLESNSGFLNRFNYKIRFSDFGK